MGVRALGVTVRAVCQGVEGWGEVEFDAKRGGDVNLQIAGQVLVW